MVLRPSFANGFAPRDGQAIWPELWRGCVGAWNPGLGPTGIRLYDHSPYKNHGTLTNMDAGGDWVTSQVGYALDFDGVNDFVNINVVVDAYPFTMSCWVSPATTATNSTFMSLNVAGSTNQYFSLEQRSSVFSIVARNTSALIATGTTASTLNVWRHIAGVFDSPVSHRLFVSGVLEATQTTSVTMPSCNSLLLAKVRTTDAAVILQGRVADSQIYNRALSANEIRLLATRPGIAYELAPRRWSAEMIDAYRRRTQYAQLVGGGII